jgi:hypothetical protein
MNAGTGRLFPSSSLKFLGNCRIAEILFVKINDMKPKAMFHFALAQIVQVRLPVTVLGQVVCQMLRNKYMASISAIHDTLRDVDPCSSDIRPVVDIDGLIDWAAVNSHAYPDMRMILQRTADFQRASRRLFWAMKKQKRHPVSCWQPNELATCFRRPKTFGAAHELI